MNILKALAFSLHIAKPTQTQRASLRSIGSNRAELFDSSFSRNLLNRILNSLSHVYKSPKAGSNNTNSNIGEQERQSLKRAIEELNACSDTELRDLGISRGEIRQAVLHGRNGIEYGNDKNHRSAA